VEGAEADARPAQGVETLGKPRTVADATNDERRMFERRR
jgi:hypothetical protein